MSIIHYLHIKRKERKSKCLLKGEIVKEFNRRQLISNLANATWFLASFQRLLLERESERK